MVIFDREFSKRKYIVLSVKLLNIYNLYVISNYDIRIQTDLRYGVIKRIYGFN